MCTWHVQHAAVLTKHLVTEVRLWCVVGAGTVANVLCGVEAFKSQTIEEVTRMQESSNWANLPTGCLPECNHLSLQHAGGIANLGLHHPCICHPPGMLEGHVHNEHDLPWTSDVQQD